MAAIWGIPIADITALLRKTRPKSSVSGKTSSWRGKNTPAESTRYTVGIRFSIAMFWVRMLFFVVNLGHQVSHEAHIGFKAGRGGVNLRSQKSGALSGIGVAAAGHRGLNFNGITPGQEGATRSTDHRWRPKSWF